jgi:hypothetical protein
VDEIRKLVYRWPRKERSSVQLGLFRSEFSSGGSYYGAGYGAAAATVKAAGILAVEASNAHCPYCTISEVSKADELNI